MEQELLTLSSLIGDVGLIGAASLIALHMAGRNVAEEELCLITKVDSLATLRKYLRKCEILEYATSIQRAAKEKIFWHITNLGRTALRAALSLLGLPGASTDDLSVIAPADSHLRLAPAPDGQEKNFFLVPSSSSDQILDQASDQILDQIKSEEEEIAFKKILCRQFGFTGQKAIVMQESADITPALICGWMAQVGQMKRDNFKFRKTPESYALGCLIKYDRKGNRLPPDRPNEDAMSAGSLLLRHYETTFRPEVAEDSIDPGDDEDEDESVLHTNDRGDTIDHAGRIVNPDGSEPDGQSAQNQSLEHKLFWTAAARAQADLGGLFQIVASSDVTIDGSTYTLRPSILCAFREWRDKIERTLTAAVRDTADDDDWIVVISNDWKSSPD
jgi:hypothetical protein